MNTMKIHQTVHHPSIVFFKRILGCANPNLAYYIRHILCKLGFSLFVLRPCELLEFHGASWLGDEGG